LKPDVQSDLIASGCLHRWGNRRLADRIAGTSALV